MPYLRLSFRMTWVTLSDLAKYSMRGSIARPLCDSWASCQLNWRTIHVVEPWTWTVGKLSPWSAPADRQLTIRGHSRCRSVSVYYFQVAESSPARPPHAGVTRIFTADWRRSSRLVVSMLANSCQDQTAAGLVETAVITDMAAHCR